MGPPLPPPPIGPNKPFKPPFACFLPASSWFTFTFTFLFNLVHVLTLPTQKIVIAVRRCDISGINNRSE